MSTNSRSRGYSAEDGLSMIHWFSAQVRRPIRRRSLGYASLGWTVALVLASIGSARVQASTPIALDLAPQPLPRLQPGIVVGEQTRFGYSDVVTVVLPRLASGAVDSLPDYAKRYAGMFNMTILANVVERNESGRTAYLLDKVGVGFAMEIAGKMTVVTSDTANQLGANLGMIDRGVLSGNEDCLEDVTQVARTDRLVVFDAKAHMLIGEKHEQRILRHMIWASPVSGKLGFLVWQLKDTDNGHYTIDSAEMQFLPSAFREDRRIHVSAGNFLSSKIPTPDRFALERIPQGTSVPFSDRMKRVAGLKSMTQSDLENLLAGVSESLAMLQVPSVAKKP